MLVAQSEIDRLALQSLSPVVVGDARIDPRFRYPGGAKEGIVSVLVVPLQVQSQSIGVLRVYTGESGHSARRNVNWPKPSPSLSAMAIENARLYERLDQPRCGAI